MERSRSFCKQLSLHAPGQERFTRFYCLGADYTKEALRERGTTQRGYSAAAKKPSSAQARTRFDETSCCIKQLEARIAEVAQLEAHIINYSKTREIYAAYKKSHHKKEFMPEHGDEIAKHEVAKAPLMLWVEIPSQRWPNSPRNMPLYWRRSRSSTPSAERSSRTESTIEP